MPTSNAKIETTSQREAEEQLFGLLWGATFVQAGLILWELLILFWSSNTGQQLWGPVRHAWVHGLHANEFTTTIYMAFQLAYMGKKEYSRWGMGIPGLDILKAGADPSRNNPSHRICKGETALVFWGVLLIVSGFMSALGWIARVPEELLRTTIQVTGLFAFSAASKEHKAIYDSQKILSAQKHKIRKS